MHALRRLACLCLAGLLLPAFAQPTEVVPFITSPDNVTQEMLRIADVGPTDHVIDLGSGDGRIVIQAARQFGATGLGVDIDPQLVRRSLDNARAAGVAERVHFLEQDLFRTDLSRGTVITMYLLPEVNLQLRPRLLALTPGTRVVSHDWDMGDWLPDRTTVVAVPDKQVGLEKSSKVHLWVVPARVGGLWCGDGLLHEFRIEVSQRHQVLDAQLKRRHRVRAVQARVEGNIVRTASYRNGSLELEVEGDQLRIVGGSGLLALTRGQSFTRSRDGSCGA